LFASSAEGGVWTNGEEAAYFHKLLKPQRHLREWTNIPRFGETWDVVGNYRKEDLKPPRNLKQVFKRCHNALYREGLDSEDVAMDMVRIILAKYQDELSESDVCDFRCTPSEYETAEGCTAVAGRVRSLFAQVVNAYPDVFDEGEHITI